MIPTLRVLKRQPADHQSDAHPTVPPRPVSDPLIFSYMLMLSED